MDNLLTTEETVAALDAHPNSYLADYYRQEMAKFDKVKKAQNVATLKAVGNWLAQRGMGGQDGSYPHFVRVELTEIDALRRGEAPDA